MSFYLLHCVKRAGLIFKSLALHSSFKVTVSTGGWNSIRRHMFPKMYPGSDLSIMSSRLRTFNHFLLSISTKSRPYFPTLSSCRPLSSPPCNSNMYYWNHINWYEMNLSPSNWNMLNWKLHEYSMNLPPSFLPLWIFMSEYVHQQQRVAMGDNPSSLSSSSHPSLLPFISPVHCHHWSPHFSIIQVYLNSFSHLFYWHFINKVIFNFKRFFSKVKNLLLFLHCVL